MQCFGHQHHAISRLVCLDTEKCIVAISEATPDDLAGRIGGIIGNTRIFWDSLLFADEEIAYFICMLDWICVALFEGLYSNTVFEMGCLFLGNALPPFSQMFPIN